MLIFVAVIFVIMIDDVIIIVFLFRVEIHKKIIRFLIFVFIILSFFNIINILHMIKNIYNQSKFFHL